MRAPVVLGAMTGLFGWVAVALAGPGGGAPLARARAALATGQIPAAIAAATLAVQAAPEEGVCHLVLGLALFGAERYEDALAAFRAAGGATRPAPPAKLAFNVGSALYELGRFEEAERAYLDASSDATLAAMARTNAGLAAVSRGDASAARAHAEAAALLARSPTERSAHGELEEAIAVEGTGTVPEAEPMAAAPRPLPGRGAGLALHLAIEGGYDSNVAQLGRTGVEPLRSEEPDRDGAFTGVLVELSHGRAIGASSFASAAYGVEQIAYAAPENDGYGVQLHTLSLEAEASPVAWLRLGLAVGGEIEAAGLRAYTPFLTAAVAEPSVTVIETTSLSAVLRLRVERAFALDEEAEPIAGTRLQARVAQRWRGDTGTAELFLGYRRDARGERIIDLAATRSGVTGTLVVPYSEEAWTAGARAEGKLRAWRLSAGGRLERILDTKALSLTLRGPLGRTIERQVRREDTRSTFSASLSRLVGESWEMGARYEVALNDSSMESTFDDKDFVKQTFTLALGWDW